MTQSESAASLKIAPAVRPGPEPEALGSEPIATGQPLVGSQGSNAWSMYARSTALYAIQVSLE